MMWDDDEEEDLDDGERGLIRVQLILMAISVLLSLSGLIATDPLSSQLCAGGLAFAVTALLHRVRSGRLWP